jgi:glycosyltransferase involved in cell wall biosynthesis
MPVLDPHPVYFPAAVRSVLDQTLDDIELVIVEDPSARSAAEMLQPFKDPRIRHYLNPQRTCLVDQRNATLGHARADLIACLDADDVCEPDRLQKQVDYLRQHPDVCVVGSQLTIIDENSQPRGHRNYPMQHEEIIAALPRFNPIAQPAVMFRSGDVQQVGGYEYKQYVGLEDYDLWSRLAKRGFRFANHPQRLLRYRIHPGGLKASKLRGMIRGTLTVKRMHWSGQMGLRGRLRMLLERMLLWMPPGLVLKAFLSTHVRSVP